MIGRLKSIWGYNSMKREIENIVLWLQQKVTEANAQGLAVGLSGGLDSAVVAALIKKAYPNNSLGIIIPINSHSQDATDAKTLVESIDLTSYEIDLTQEHEAILSKSLTYIQAATNMAINNRSADSNLRARLRMSAVYTAANALNYLVVGTDNKAEAYTGYFTKYGDGGVDIQPLGEYTKAEVRAMARVLEVPEEIVAKPPSAGLWVGQTDEQEMGTSYDHIDAYLKGEPVPEKDHQIIERLHRITEHKRQMPPIYQRTGKH